jgi:hypothetical protein
MAKHDEAYERAIAKLLTDSLEQNIPADTDVWAAVKQKLSQHNTTAAVSAEAHDGPVRDRSGNPLAGASTSTTPRRWATLGRSYLRTAAGWVAFALLALLTVTVISRFAQRTDVNIVRIPMNLSNMLFTIPVDQANIHWSADCGPLKNCAWAGVTGIAAAPDGTFYIADADERLLHYSGTGTLMGVQSYMGSTVPLFFTMQGNDLWLFQSTSMIAPDARTITGFYKVSADGTELGSYKWETIAAALNRYNGPSTVYSGTQSISIVAGITSLQIGGDGQLMVETTPLTDQNVPDYTKSYLIQVIGADGKPDLKLLPGYPARGKYYTTEVAPDAKSGYVTNGDIRVEITSTQYIRRLDVHSVRPNGSFYVISEEHFSPPSPNGPELVHVYLDANYIYHYSADGRLIDRARLPGYFIQHIGTIRQLTQDQNGTFYWLLPVYPSEGGGDLDPTSVEIHRINFFPPDQPLPGPEPTVTPTSITTAAPTTPTARPTPLVITELPDYTVLFPLTVGNPPSGRETFKGNFSMASDGNLWVNYDSTLQGERVLRKFGTEGTLLSIIKLPDQIRNVLDLNAEGDYIWVLDVDAVYELGLDGSIIATYHPTLPVDFPRHPSGLYQYHLRWAPDGELLVEDVFTSTYTKVAPTLDANGKPGQVTYPGYPGNGNYYVRGAQPNQIAVAGKTVTIQVEGYVHDWHIARELPDGSFYVIVNATGSAGMAQGEYIYVMHYSSYGKLMEQARAASPGEAAGTFQARTQDIQMGPNNEFYAVGSPGLDSQRGLDPGQVHLVRLRFYPANQPLPPVPTQMP